MTSGARRVAGPVGEDRLPRSARLVLGHLGEAGAGDQLHGGEDPAHEVGAAGAHVLVGGVEDRLERGPERLLARHFALPELLERVAGVVGAGPLRSEEHTSELQSRSDLVCRLLLEKKKTETKQTQKTPP